MISLNKAFFRRLYRDAFGEENLRYHACIQTSPTEKEFIKNTKSVKSFQSLDLKISIITHKTDGTFLAILGKHQFREIPQEMRLQLLDEDAGIVTILGGSEFLGAKNVSELRDQNWSTIKSEETGGPDGITLLTLDEIKAFLDDFSYYKIERLPFDPLNGGEDRLLLLLLVLLNIGRKDKLQIKPQILDILINIDNFPFHLLHSAYVGQTWHHSYIDMYRCIEMLYPIPRMINLRGLIESRIGRQPKEKILAMELFDDVHKTTGWKEIEINGLEHLIKDCSQETISEVFSMLESEKLIDSNELEIIKELSKSELMSMGAFKSVVEFIRNTMLALPEADISKIKEYRSKRAASLIANTLYSTRNELVHYRAPKKMPSEEKIKTAFRSLALIINDAYKKHEAETYQ